MDEPAVRRARELFLDERHLHGCAETTFVVLKEAFGLPDADNAAAAMALNGGVAYSGGMCGAITGAAMALGLLADRRLGGRGTAKTAARRMTANLMAAFESEHGALACRELIGMDIRTDAQHRRFIESGIWRDRCMRQVEFAVRRLAPFGGDAGWTAAILELELPAP